MNADSYQELLPPKDGYVDPFEEAFDGDEQFDLGDDFSAEVIAVAEETERQAAVRGEEMNVADMMRTFKQHCQKQIQSKRKGWDTTHELPWKLDSQLKSKIQQIGCTRRQASKWWLQLKQSKGQMNATKVDKTINELFANYEKQIGPLMDNICSVALSQTKLLIDSV